MFLQITSQSKLFRLSMITRKNTTNSHLKCPVTMKRRKSRKISATKYGKQLIKRRDDTFLSKHNKNIHVPKKKELCLY